MSSVAVIQSNYIPWKGYFDIIHDVERFVFYDDVQYTKNDWRNRNRIKTAAGAAWITIPIGGDIDRQIKDVAIVDTRWAARHYKSIVQNYSRRPHFAEYRAFLEHVYLERRWDNLSELNRHLVTTIAKTFLGLTTEFRDSAEYAAQGQRGERLLDLLARAGATTYVSGPSARGYIDESLFDAAGIQLIYKSYDGYPEYPQAFPPFDHNVSILDLLFNVGPDAPWYIWGWREERRGIAERS